MSEQSYFDSIDFPLPDDYKKKRKVYYLIDFNYERSGKLLKISRVYIEENLLEEYLDYLLEIYYNLFRSLISFHAIEKREEYVRS